MENEKKNLLTAEADGIIEGRNAVIEALRAGIQIDKMSDAELEALVEMYEERDALPAGE